MVHYLVLTLAHLDPGFWNASPPPPPSQPRFPTCCLFCLCRENRRFPAKNSPGQNAGHSNDFEVKADLKEIPVTSQPTLATLPTRRTLLCHTEAGIRFLTFHFSNILLCASSVLAKYILEHNKGHRTIRMFLKFY